jgi:hypothetical protein
VIQWLPELLSLLYQKSFLPFLELPWLLSFLSFPLLWLLERLSRQQILVLLVLLLNL